MNNDTITATTHFFVETDEIAYWDFRDSEGNIIVEVFEQDTYLACVQVFSVLAAKYGFLVEYRDLIDIEFTDLCLA